MHQHEHLEPGDDALIEAIGHHYTTKPMSRVERETFEVELMRRHARTQNVRRAGLGAMIVLTLSLGLWGWAMVSEDDATPSQLVEAPEQVDTHPADTHPAARAVVEEREPERIALTPFLLGDYEAHDISYIPDDYKAILDITELYQPNLKPNGRPR